MNKNEMTILGFSIIWFIPWFLILFTDKVKKSEKVLWLMLIFFGTWFAYGFYHLVAPIKGEDK